MNTNFTQKLFLATLLGWCLYESNSLAQAQLREKQNDIEIFHNNKGKAPKDLKKHTTFKGNEGKGGGGIHRKTVNGEEYLTFGSSEVKLTLAEETDIPGADLARRVIQKLDLPLEIKGMVLGSILPNDRHHFYFMEALSASEQSRLIQIYSNLIQIKENEDVVIYAVTDTVHRETYLLPEFKKLKQNEKYAHILFHEGMWLLDPRDPRQDDEYPHVFGTPPTVGYDQVVSAEKSFAEYIKLLEQGQDPFPLSLYKNLSIIAKNPSLLISAAIAYDARKGHLNILKMGNSEYVNVDELFQVPDNALVQQGAGRSSNCDQFSRPETMRTYALSQSELQPNKAIYQVLAWSPQVCFKFDHSVIDTKYSFFKWKKEEHYIHHFVEYETQSHSIHNSTLNYEFDEFTYAITNKDTTSCVVIQNIAY